MSSEGQTCICRAARCKEFSWNYCKVNTIKPKTVSPLSNHTNKCRLQAGCWVRGFCFANDATSDTGVVWSPKRCVILPHIPKNQDFSTFRAAHADAHRQAEIRSPQPMSQNLSSEVCDLMLTPDRGSRLPPAQGHSSRGTPAPQAHTL